MSIVTLDLPLGRRPKSVYQDIRVKMVDWLEVHVGPVTEPFLSYNLLVEEEEFLLLRNAYLETVGNTWDYWDQSIVVGATSGEQWRLFHVRALTSSLDMTGGMQFRHQFGVYLEDEMLAMQFKLACL
jgi:hypothetical protein